MKKIILGIVLVSLVSCDCFKCKEKKRLAHPEMKYLPKSAKFIKNYDSDRRDLWIKWELDGECFLSYNVEGQTGLLTKVDCPL